MTPELARVIEVRRWIHGQMSPETLRFPTDDDVWQFITARWPLVSTHDAEKLLGEAMRPIAV